MRFWNCSSKQPDDPGVSVTIGGQVVKPGEAVDVPVHFVAEASHLMAKGLITNERPPVVPAAPAAPPPEEPAAPAEEPSETDDSQPREGSRRRRH
jgi:hypothetical protein